MLPRRAPLRIIKSADIRLDMRMLGDKTWRAPADRRGVSQL